MPNHVLQLEDGSQVVISDEREPHEIPPTDLCHYIFMAQFVGKGFTPTPIEKIEIKPYDFRVEDEID